MPRKNKVCGMCNDLRDPWVWHSLMAGTDLSVHTASRFTSAPSASLCTLGCSQEIEADGGYVRIHFLIDEYIFFGKDTRRKGRIMGTAAWGQWELLKKP